MSAFLKTFDVCQPFSRTDANRERVIEQVGLALRAGLEITPEGFA